MTHINNNPDVSNAKIIRGSYHKYKDWVEDPKGYFLIRPNKEKGLLELGFCRQDNIIEVLVQGLTPQEVYFTAIEYKLISRLDHAAYIGKELEKAYLALKKGIEYIQDEDLKIE
jgi:tetrahydromethanopterin S-methyltransferase subunit A